MDVTEDGQRLTASLAAWLDRLTFVSVTADEATAQIITSVAEWARGHGWRVYLRARSVVPLPPPMSWQHSVLDVACARMDGPPVVIEVDHTDRRRTMEKLVAEAAAGRIAIWVRWGTGRFTAPPPSVHLVTCLVDRHRGAAGQGPRFSRVQITSRPAPTHSQHDPGVASPAELPIPEPPPRALPGPGQTPDPPSFE